MQRSVRTTEGGREGLREGGTDEEDVYSTDASAEKSEGGERGKKKRRGVRKALPLRKGLFRNREGKREGGGREGGGGGGQPCTYAMYNESFNPFFAAIRPERGIPTRKAPPVATPWKRPRA